MCCAGEPVVRNVCLCVCSQMSSSLTPHLPLCCASPPACSPLPPSLPSPGCSMEGATLSGRQCAYKVLEDAEQLAAAAAAKKQQQAVAA